MSGRRCSGAGPICQRSARRVMGPGRPGKEDDANRSKGHGTRHWTSDEFRRMRSCKKIMRATTDSKPGVDFDDPGAGVRNLLAIFQAFTEASQRRNAGAGSPACATATLRKLLPRLWSRGVEPDPETLPRDHAGSGSRRGISRFGIGGRPAHRGNISRSEKVKRAMGLLYRRLISARTSASASRATYRSSSPSSQTWTSFKAAT